MDEVDTEPDDGDESSTLPTMSEAFVRTQSMADIDHEVSDSDVLAHI